MTLTNDLDYNVPVYQFGSPVGSFSKRHLLVSIHDPSIGLHQYRMQHHNRPPVRHHHTHTYALARANEPSPKDFHHLYPRAWNIL